MRRTSFTAIFLIFAALLAGESADSRGQANPAMKEEAPLRVALAGLVHGHASGFFDQFQRRTDLRIVAITEADGQLVAQFEKKYGLAPSLFYSNLEEMLNATHPQAVLVYTNTYDHRRVVEICARDGVHVMMEKPLAVSLEDARAIRRRGRGRFRFW